MYYGSIVFPHSGKLDSRGCYIIGDWDGHELKCVDSVYFHGFDEFIVEYLKTRLYFPNHRFYYHDDSEFSRYFRNRVISRVDLDPNPFFRRLKRYDLSSVSELLMSGCLKYPKDGLVMNALHMWDIGKGEDADVTLPCLGILCYGMLRRVDNHEKRRHF